MCSFKVYFDSKIEIIDDLSHTLSLPHLFLPPSLARYFGMVCVVK